MARFTLPRDLYNFNAKNTITDACMGPPPASPHRKRLKACYYDTEIDF